MESVGKRIAKYSGMILVTSILMKGIIMIQSIAVARLLGPESLGVFAIISRLGEVFATIAGFGMAIAVIRVLPEHRVKNPEKVDRTLVTYFWLTVLTTLPILGLYFILVPYLAVNLYGEPKLIFLLYLSILGMIIGIFVAVFDPVLRVYQKIPLMAKLKMALGIPGAGITIAFVYLFGLEGVFYAGITMGLVALAVYSVVFRNQITARISKLFMFDSDIAKSLIIFWGPATLAAIFTVVGNWYGATFLQRSAGFAELGMFNVGNSASLLILFIPNAIAVPFIPIITETYAKDRKEFERVLYRALKYVLIICFPICLLFSLFSRTIITVVYSDVYVGAAPILVVMTSVAFLLCYASIAGYLFYILKVMKRLILINGIRFAILLPLMTILIQQYSALGLAYSFLIAFLINLQLSLLIIRDRFRILRLYKYMIWCEGFSLLILCVGLLVGPLDLIMKSVVLAFAIPTYYVVLDRYVLTPTDKKYLWELVVNVKRKILR